jgi:hypothetical protein
MRQVAGRNPLLQASVLLEEADMASSEGEASKALHALQRASVLAPQAVWWYAQQRHAFQELRGRQEFEAAVQEARAEWCKRTGRAAPERGAAPPTYVAAALAMAPEKTHARPARHSSWRALVVQGLTLTGTLALLLWWTWHFFLSPG